jgi:hypothetical protein
MLTRLNAAAVLLSPNSNFHTLWRRPRGMFFNLDDKGQLASMIYNWPQVISSYLILVPLNRHR